MIKNIALSPKPAFWLYFLTFVLFSITTLSRLLFNGMIFDFDYHLYQPDGAVYTYMALKFSGMAHLEAAHEVISWYSIYAEPGTSLTIEFFSAETNPGVWSLGSTRVVYPLLSVPFVLLFGIPGMLVVPVLSLLLLLILITKIAVKQQNYLVGFLLILFLTTSPTVSRWYVANITDGPLATVIATATYLLLKKNSNRIIMIVSLLVVMGSFIRFSTPFWYAIVLLLWFVNRKFSLLLFVISTISLIPTLLAKPDPGSIVAGANGGAIEKIIYFPISAIKVGFIEISQLAAIDRSLLVVLLTAIILSVGRLKDSSSQFFIMIGLAGWFIGALNGVLGVNFRYQLPLLFFACWTILEKLQLSRDGLIRGALNIMGDKAK